MCVYTHVYNLYEDTLLAVTIRPDKNHRLSNKTSSTSLRKMPFKFGHSHLRDFQINIYHCHFHCLPITNLRQDSIAEGATYSEVWRKRVGADIEASCFEGELS